jgi:hypothetical protein
MIQTTGKTEASNAGVRLARDSRPGVRVIAEGREELPPFPSPAFPHASENARIRWPECVRHRHSLSYSG